MTTTKEEANRNEKIALHSALTTAQQLVAQETRYRLKAEKKLATEKVKKMEQTRHMKAQQADRDKANAHNLDKLHVMYGKQIEKLRKMLDTEGNQLANAREEIAEMTMAHMSVDGSGQYSSQHRSSSNQQGSNSSTNKTIQGAADLILLERLATVEEECANAKDQVLLMTEEKNVMTVQMAGVREEQETLHARMKRAEKLVHELKRALKLSKEESTLLESERQRLMKENMLLTRAMEKMDRMVYGKNKDTPRIALSGRHPMSRSFTAPSTTTANHSLRQSKKSSREIRANKEKVRLTQSFSKASSTYGRKSGARGSAGRSSGKMSKVGKRMLRDPMLR